MGAINSEWLYRCLGPTAWPSPPHRFSYSSVCQIEECPLQWQLAHATYGDHRDYPTRPSIAAVEGQIVHEVLESLYRRAACAGLPEYGTPEFRAVISAVKPYDMVKELRKKHADSMRAHPRGMQVRFKTPTQQIVNRAARLFRSQYPMATVTWRKPKLSGATRRSPHTTEETRPLDLLDMVGAISEYKLKHPRLPFSGVIDLVLRTERGTVIVDFKTGIRNEKHRKQILYYGILWWRNTGEIPTSLELRYMDGIDVLDAPQFDLTACELEMEERISSVVDLIEKMPADARLRESCSYCNVRQFCDEYWSDRKIMSSLETVHRFIDVELVVISVPSANGFEGCANGDSMIPVTYESGLDKIHGPFEQGELIRILGGYVASEGNSIELKVRTEVFHRGVGEVCPA